MKSNRSTGTGKKSVTNEIDVIKHQVVDLETLSKRNAELEEEVERLYLELDEVTNGILKRGYLFKWR